MAYMLDTNVVSDILRNPAGRAAKRSRTVGEQHIFLSVIVAAELRFGLTRRPSATFRIRLEELLEQFRVLAVETPTDRVYATLRAQLEMSGTPISANDMFIAAHAIKLGHTLVTDNIREFSRIEAIRLENWIR